MDQQQDSKKYWNDQYESNQTGWDIGYASPAIREYVDQLPNKNIAILIPGCGNAHEAAYLLSKGFSNITLIDIAPTFTAQLEQRFADELGKSVTVITGDFFNHKGQYDLIIEQTFLSALDPSLRPSYVKQMQSLLKPGGHLAGVLFSKYFDEAPPHGGTEEEYKKMFGEAFFIKQLEPCKNSIERRQGSEVFINLVKSRVRIYALNQDVDLACIPADSFPQGIAEAQGRVLKITAGQQHLNYYGVSYLYDDQILYMAGVQTNGNVKTSATGRPYTLKKGKYIGIYVTDFRTNISLIKKAFKELLADPNIDEEGCCAERYLPEGTDFLTATDVLCMVRLTQ